MHECQPLLALVHRKSLGFSTLRTLASLHFVVKEVLLRLRKVTVAFIDSVDSQLLSIKVRDVAKKETNPVDISAAGIDGRLRLSKET